MKKYEVMYILKPNVESLPETVKRFEDIIRANDGTVEKTDVWGEKKLCYEIAGNHSGIYVLVSFEGKIECVKELDRKLRLDEDILRFMIIKKS